MSFIKNIQAKSLFRRGLSAAQSGNINLAVNLLQKSSSILLEMISAGEEKYRSHYARTEMNLGVLYNKTGETDESLHSFLMAIRTLAVLVKKGRIDLMQDLSKTETVFNTLYPGAKIDLERGIITGS